MIYLLNFLLGICFVLLCQYIFNQKIRTAINNKVTKSKLWIFLFYNESYNYPHRETLPQYQIGSDDGIFWLLLRKDFLRVKLKINTQFKIFKSKLIEF